ncbi:hypothetical protein RRG08_061290 [Elysia crispata]|uniref:Uncharacterized protein n=1 Tax=Elysia crispata TaxID=231223 RepID=A0AAE0YEU9_9GAST|nr:hypothetical protein RRG08_061290 [Elysia crispata]
MDDVLTQPPVLFTARHGQLSPAEGPKLPKADEGEADIPSLFYIWGRLEGCQFILYLTLYQGEGQGVPLQKFLVRSYKAVYLWLLHSFGHHPNHLTGGIFQCPPEGLAVIKTKLQGGSH